MKLLECNKVAVGYDKKIIAENISFSLSSGDYLAITGENGAGKSTLVKTLLGLIPHISGEIKTHSEVKLSDIGYLPQSSYTDKNFPASVYEVVMSGRVGKLGLFPFYSQKDKRTVTENMKKLGLLPIKDRYFGELSGGQAQRVLLCRALSAANKLLLLDEPVQCLDPHGAHDMYEAVAELNRTDNIAVMMVSHDICTTLAYATHVLHLGKDVVFFGTVEEYRKSLVGSEFIYAHGGEGHCH